MPDALAMLTQVEGLAPRDAVIGRALIRNRFVEARLVVAAAKAAAAGIDGDLLDQLTSGGHLSSERALQIEEALEKRIAEKMAASTASPSESTRRRAKKQTSTSRRGGKRSGGTTVTLLEAIRDERERRDREQNQLFIERFIRSRLHQLMLGQLERRREGIIEPKTLARTTGADRERVKAILGDWKNKGLLQTYGTFPFYYSPQQDHREAIGRFMKAWNDPSEHKHLLQKILEVEAR